MISFTIYISARAQLVSSQSKVKIKVSRSYDSLLITILLYMDDISSFCMKAARGGGNGGGGGGTKCGRWNPTAEQVKVLTDLFRSGLRTPSTDQIQRISSQLSYYGKIESKNVFYWFQNHKARERQKRRRVSTAKENHHPLQHNNLNNNSSSLTRNFFSSSNLSYLLSLCALKIYYFV